MNRYCITFITFFQLKEIEAKIRDYGAGQWAKWLGSGWEDPDALRALSLGCAMLGALEGGRSVINWQGPHPFPGRWTTFLMCRGGNWSRKGICRQVPGLVMNPTGRGAPVPSSGLHIYVIH